jgi:hypothetical protein
MIRETLNANAINATTLLTPGQGVNYQWRLATGGGTSYSQTSGLTAPYWVRVVRTGSSFVGYSSADGTTWTVMSAQTINMASSVYIGLAVTSHADPSLCTAVIDNVTATP